MIELKHLKTLMALQQYGSVSHAAERLYMTQSALSHQIKQLESMIGMKLFERKSSPLVFTQAGKLLLKTAQEILPKLSQTESVLKSLKSGAQGRLFIGVECHTCFEWLLPMVRDYQQTWRGVDLDIINSLVASGQSALQNLTQQKLDLVITSDPEPSQKLTFKELFSYEQLLVLPIGHPLAQKDWIEPQNLTDETLIHYPVPTEKLDVFKRFLHPANCLPKAQRQSEITLMMLQLIESEKGVGVLPKWLLQTLPGFEHLPTVRLGQNGLWSTLYAAVNKEQENLPYLNDFMDKVRERMT